MIAGAGGNPAAHLQDTTLDSCCPTARTGSGASSPFAGDYRSMGVTSVGIDLFLAYVDFSAGGRPLTLFLQNDKGTPSNTGDDFGAYFIGPDNVPLVGDGWVDYDFAVDAQATALPAGWVLFGNVAPGQPATWSDVVTDVDSVRFFYGDPTFFFIFQMWDVGMDNPRITFADCNGNDVPDDQDVAGGTSLDLDGDGVPDECQPLSADTGSLSLSAGGTQAFTLDAGLDRAGDVYWIFGSATGTSPGTDLGGGLTLPLNFDPYFALTLGSPFAAPFSGFLGVLDGSGEASAALLLPPASDPSLAGLELHHAYVTARTFGQTTFASNAMPVALVP